MWSDWLDRRKCKPFSVCWYSYADSIGFDFQEMRIWAGLAAFGLDLEVVDQGTPLELAEIEIIGITRDDRLRIDPVAVNTLSFVRLESTAWKSPPSGSR